MGVQLHYIDLTRCPPYARCYAVLNAAEHARLEAFASEELRRRFAARRWALRGLLAHARGSTLAEVTLQAEPRGRLRFADGGGPWFSAAQRGERAVVAWSEREVGVDLELDGALSGDPPIALLALEEQTWFADQPVAAAFLRLWTAKEAYLKARGVGLSEELTASAVIPDVSGAQLARVADGDLAWVIARADGDGTVVSVCHRPGETLVVAEQAQTRALLDD